MLFCLLAPFQEDLVLVGEKVAHKWRRIVALALGSLEDDSNLKSRASDRFDHVLIFDHENCSTTTDRITLSK